MLTPSRCHWNDSGAVPDALTLKDAGWPAETVRLAGCDVTSGAWSSVNSTRQTEPVPRSRYQSVPSLASFRSTGLLMPLAKAVAAKPAAGFTLRIQPLQKSAKKNWPVNSGGKFAIVGL